MGVVLVSVKLEFKMEMMSVIFLQSYCPRLDHSCVYRNQTNRTLIFFDDFGDYISPTCCHGYRKETSH